MRYISVDFLRGLAIFAMIQVHIWEYYIRIPTGLGDVFSRYFVGPLGGYAAPLFTMISGTSAFLLFRKSRLSDKNLTIFYWRGLLLFALATSVNLVVSWVTRAPDLVIFNWGVIQLIGFCLMILPFFARLNWVMQIVALAGVMVFSRQPVPVGAVSWFNQGFAPPLPWSVLFFGGFLLGKVLFPHHQFEPAGNNLRLEVAGLFFGLIVILALNKYDQAFAWTHYTNPSSATLLGFLWLFTLLTAAAKYLLDAKKIAPYWVRSFANFGKRALTIYYAQLLIIVFSAQLIQMFSGVSMRVFPWIMYFPLTIICILSLDLLVNQLWGKIDYRYSLEWFFAGILEWITARSARKKVGQA